MLLVKPLSKTQLRNRLFLICVLSGVLLVSRFWDPDQIKFIPCLYRDVTGNPCLTCGMTHAFFAMAHGRFSEAFSANTAGALLFILLFVFIIKYVIEIKWGRSIY